MLQAWESSLDDVTPSLTESSAPPPAERSKPWALPPRNPFEGTIDVDANLYHATDEALLEILRRQGDVPRVMIVGHNEGLENFLIRMTRTALRFPTAALARLSFPLSSWQNLAFEQAEDLELWTPKKDLE